ncbi:MAG TPA: response regulator [Ktedonobacterales bacterium]|nr:response regulator [Ktedonobacterales bacterium]
MQAVMIVERDEDLRETLEMVLEEAGYPTLSTCDLALAEAALRVTKHPLVVLVEHGGPSSLATPLLDHTRALPPHAYVVLSTRPQAAMPVWNSYTHRGVPVVRAPFTLDELLTQIDMAAAAIQHRADEAQQVYAAPAPRELAAAVG